MEAAKTETTKEITQSEEMSKLYRALTITQANIFLYLRKATDEEDLKRRATDIIENLETIIVKYEDTAADKRCENGQVWNPVTQRCE